MNVLGIIAEYNPFHNGHLYHLKESIKLSEADYNICIMSGNFLQRGEPALFNKWMRAETAVKNGIDLVIELPTVFACSSAEYFAYGAVSILNSLGCVTHISFGSEHGDMNIINKTAQILASETDVFQKTLKKHLSKGISFPLARKKSFDEITNINNILNEPNNILGVEYSKALIRSNSPIQSITIPRKDARYHSTSIEGTICSATAIREMLKEKNSELEYIKDSVPIQTYETIVKYISEGVTPLYLSDVFTLLQYKLITSEYNELHEIFSAVEGIENRIINELQNTNNINDLVQNVKSKRYTQTSIQRLLIHILLGLTKQDMSLFSNDTSSLYARILGFSNKGSQLLRYIKKSDKIKIPLITNINKKVIENPSIEKLLKYDILASDIYNLASNQYNLYNESDFVKKPFILRTDNL